jgi:L-methionine (R)-S-oxide reductase
VHQANSKSEIVIPIHVNDEIIGVLDIDAPITDRFTNEDKENVAWERVYIFN